VNHDVLMGRLAKRIVDRRVLGLIRRYLEAGVMVDGVVTERQEGTPQGGPLSPLLANTLLDEVDNELEKRGHAFVRYADDCNVYVRSKRAGERVMTGLRGLFGKLHLRVNETKSAVAPPWDRKFLGFSFALSKDGRIRRTVAGKALETMRHRVRALTGRCGGRSMATVIQKLRSYLLGWKAYFQLAETPATFGKLDAWIRHRLRAIQLQHWKNASTIYRELRKRGVPLEGGGNARQRWLLGLRSRSCVRYWPHHRVGAFLAPVRISRRPRDPELHFPHATGPRNDPPARRVVARLRDGRRAHCSSTERRRGRGHGDGSSRRGRRQRFLVAASRAGWRRRFLSTERRARGGRLESSNDRRWDLHDERAAISAGSRYMQRRGMRGWM
jgi:hypothetical protein